MRWSGPNRLLSILTNPTEYAGYLQTGTRRMIRRPIDTIIINETAMSRLGRQIHYVQQALTPKGP